MFFRKSGLVLLPALAVFASHVYAEDLPELDSYTPPTQLFDAKPVKVEPLDTPALEAPLLTTIAPNSEMQEVFEFKAPVPPKKPRVPKRIGGMSPNKKPTNSTLMKKTTANKTTDVITAEMPKVPTVQPVARASKTQLEGGQRLVNPNVKDVLASIEGIKAPTKTGKDSFSLTFLPAETVLTLDMKNSLLEEYVPKVKTGKSRIEIHAYASPDKAGETGVRRISLARALETRDFLTAAGIDSGRIDVMPMGNTGQSADADHVDIVSVANKP